MGTHVKFPYKSVVRKIIARNVILLIPVLVILKVSVNGGSFLDPVAHPLVSCKCFTVLISVLEIISWFFVVQKSQKKVVLTTFKMVKNLVYRLMKSTRQTHTHERPK